MNAEVANHGRAGIDCPICGNSQTALFYVRYNHKLVRCTTCSAIYVRPTPTDAAMQAHYQRAAYFAGESEQGYFNYGDMQKALRPYFQRRLRRIESHAPQRGRLLDFGCAAGYFLELGRAHGWQITGVELSQDMARSAEQLLHTSIFTSLEEVPLFDFDAITLWEVIEHLPRPIAVLQQLYSRLKPGGVLMLSTPNTGHWQAMRHKEAWNSYRPPSHLLYFTRQTLADALRRAGFTRIEVNGVAPLPPLPAWLRRASAPLNLALATGQARPWRLALLTWRAIRLLGWAWQKAVHRSDDIFATLEALCFRPQ